MSAQRTRTTTQARGPRGVPGAWVGLLRAHSTLVRHMDANLLAAHELTINDYEVLLALSRAEDRRMRRVDLASTVLLTQSGITRLLHGLEKSGLVARAACETDGRVVYAELTEAGLDRLRQASTTHLDDIRSLFAARFSDEELTALDELLGRLVEGAQADEACAPD